MSWRTRIERGEGEVKERKRKKFFLVSSSFDPAKEFSSIEFFKKIYPGYLFAKLHSTLFLWQICLVNLVIYKKKLRYKNIFTIVFTTTAILSTSLNVEKKNTENCKNADFFQTWFPPRKWISFLAEEGKNPLYRKMAKNYLLKILKSNLMRSLKGQKCYNKKNIKKVLEVSSSFWPHEIIFVQIPKTFDTASSLLYQPMNIGKSI